MLQPFSPAPGMVGMNYGTVGGWRVRSYPCLVVAALSYGALMASDGVSFAIHDAPQGHSVSLPNISDKFHGFWVGVQQG